MCDSASKNSSYFINNLINQIWRELIWILSVWLNFNKTSNKFIVKDWNCCLKRSIKTQFNHGVMTSTSWRHNLTSQQLDKSSEADKPSVVAGWINLSLTVILVVPSRLNHWKCVSELYWVIAGRIVWTCSIENCVGSWNWKNVGSKVNKMAARLASEKFLSWSVDIAPFQNRTPL